MSITGSRRTFLQGSAVVGGVAALAACGQKSSDEQAKDAQASNSAAAEKAKSLPSTAWERADYEKVKDGGTLTFAIGQLPDNWNYYQTDGNLADLSTVLGPQGPNALIIGEKGDSKINPDYLESAEVKTEDPLVISVKFNKKAVWSDGTPITIKDLIAYAHAESGQDEAFQVVSTVGYEDIKEVRQTDDEFTGEIEFATTFADWITLVYPGLPASACSDANTFNTAYVTQPPPTAGPYTVSNIDQTGGVITLSKNEKWWGRAPKLESIIFKVVSQTQAPSSFANGEIDTLEIANGDILGQAKSRKDAAIQSSNGLTWTHLTINTQAADGALGDVKVREAMARGINRDAIGQAVVGPMEAPIVLKDNLIFMPGQDGYEDSYGKDGLKYDKAAAEKILDDAGWKKDGDVRAKDGKQLAMSITIPADTKSNSDRARQIQSDLNALGFKIEMKTVPVDGYFKDNITPKNFDLVTYSWVGTAFPQNPNLFYPATSSQNKTNFDNDAKLKDSAEKMLSTMDPEERIKASNEFSKLAAEGYTVIPFYVTPIVWGVKKGLVNLGASQFESVDWTQVGFTS